MGSSRKTGISSDHKTDESMATPCSANAIGNTLECLSVVSIHIFRWFYLSTSKNYVLILDISYIKSKSLILRYAIYC